MRTWLNPEVGAAPASAARPRRGTTRLRAKIVGPALVLAAGLWLAGAASLPASADVALCQDLVDDGYTLIEIPALPDALGATPPDCAIDQGGGFASAYWVGDVFATFISLAEALEADGWELVDRDTGSTVGVGELRAWEGQFTFASVSVSRDGEFLDLEYDTEPDGAPEVEFVGPRDGYVSLGGLTVAPSPSASTAPGLDAPSSLSDLKVIGSVIGSPKQLGFGILAALLATVAIAVPNLLFGELVERAERAWAARWRRSRLWKLRERLAARVNPGSVAIAIGASALVACFIDPAFGPNAMSVRLFVSLVASLLVFNVVAAAALGAILRKLAPGATSALELRPEGVLIMAAAVAIGRALDFNPGVILGAAIGLLVATSLGRAASARATLIVAAFTASATVTAWIVYSLLRPAAETGNPLVLALTEVFAAVTVEGASSLPLVLLPVVGLSGSTIFAWRRLAWAGAYAAALFLFLAVVVTIPSALTTVPGDFGRWLIILAGYLVAIAVALVIAKSRPEAPRSEA